jgi:hypothetical protein
MAASKSLSVENGRNGSMPLKNRSIERRGFLPLLLMA